MSQVSARVKRDDSSKFAHIKLDRASRIAQVKSGFVPILSNSKIPVNSCNDGLILGNSEKTRAASLTGL